ncbi:hypothetical protein MHBO_000174 [Bonamia ostreae]
MKNDLNLMRMLTKILELNPKLNTRIKNIIDGFQYFIDHNHNTAVFLNCSDPPLPTLNVEKYTKYVLGCSFGYELDLGLWKIVDQLKSLEYSNISQNLDSTNRMVEYNGEIFFVSSDNSNLNTEIVSLVLNELNPYLTLSGYSFNERKELCLWHKFPKGGKLTSQNLARADVTTLKKIILCMAELILIFSQQNIFVENLSIGDFCVHQDGYLCFYSVSKLYTSTNIGRLATFEKLSMALSSLKNPLKTFLGMLRLGRKLIYFCKYIKNIMLLGQKLNLVKGIDMKHLKTGKMEVFKEVKDCYNDISKKPSTVKVSISDIKYLLY